jgi:hypothetical protein
MTNDQEIRGIIEKLDLLVTRENAKIYIDYDIHETDGQILGNEKGFLRLGIEVLKCAYADYIDPTVIDSEILVKFNKKAAGFDPSELRSNELQSEVSHSVPFDIYYMLPEKQYNPLWLFRRVDNPHSFIKKAEKTKKKDIPSFIWTIIPYAIIAIFFLGILQIFEFLKNLH